MVLVDTSVLVNYLNGITNNKTTKFSELLELKIPYGINVYVYQEMLQGAKNEKDFKLLKKYLGTQRFYYLRKGVNSYKEAAGIYFDCRKKGLAISSTIDCLIAQTCIENDIYLLHDDKDFDLISKIIKIKIY